MRTLIRAIAILFLAAQASAQCLEDSGLAVDMQSTAANPVQFVTDCRCFNWAEAAIPGAIADYHFFVDGVIQGNPTGRAMAWCLPEKGVTYEINVAATSATFGQDDSPVSGSLFVEWVDRDTSTTCVEWETSQCLQGDRVIPCP